jgi:DNA-binding beta-propeller fold protein YncE
MRPCMRKMFYHPGILSSPLVCLSLSLSVTSNACWAQHGITIAGGHGQGDGLQQLDRPLGLVVDDDDTVFIADAGNNRIVAWKKGDNEGHMVAGGQGEGNGLHQLNNPTDILIDKETTSLIICDWMNRRVVRWPLNNGTQGEILINNIGCSSLATDKQRCLYVSDYEKHEVRRFARGNMKGTVVAGGNRKGDQLNQLNGPHYILVDEEQSVYVSDCSNHRVMKWLKGAEEGIVVAGGRGRGKELTHLNYPQGIWVDEMGTVYVAEGGDNHRVTRWPRGGTKGIVVVGGNGEGDAKDQFNCPTGLSFDRRGDMYVVEWGNHRVQQFELESN